MPRVAPPYRSARPPLWLLLLGLPLLELYLLMQLGRLIGAAPAVGVVVFTGLLGALVLRQAGMGALARVQDSLRRGEAPDRVILDHFLLLLAGLALLVPGPLTDLAGLALLAPPLRALVLAWALRHFPPGGGAPPGAGGRVLEGEYEAVDRDKLKKFGDR